MARGQYLPLVVDCVYHWARVAAQVDPVCRQRYEALRTRGHTYGRALRSVADRLLAVACAMLKTGTLYQRNVAETLCSPCFAQGTDYPLLGSARKIITKPLFRERSRTSGVLGQSPQRERKLLKNQKISEKALQKGRLSLNRAPSPIPATLTKFCVFHKINIWTLIREERTDR